MSDAELSSDIIEIDAASNNGVDEIRDLRDKVRYGPAITKYKVYIIDEVHMLSSGAFNALLKTLEEPPEHAIFILETTEFHRLPATIVSRCQRFDFQQLSDEIIVDHMKGILKEMERQADDQALAQIARAAEGGMRDALSLLDQCLMVSDYLTLKDVYHVIGFVGGQSVQAFIEAMEREDVAEMLKVIDGVAKSGANLEVYVRECMQTLRDRLIQPSDHRALYAYAIETLAQTQTQMRYASRPRVLLDAAAVKLEGGLPIAETVRRIVDTGIPVMGHLGLTPQSVHQLGGYHKVGKTEEEARRLAGDAAALEAAGVFGIVLECVPSAVAGEITAALRVPTIGIGSGPHCDGQVLVSYDAFGMFEGYVPAFVKQYANLGDEILRAARQYVQEVEEERFPAIKESPAAAGKDPA
jgi:DNA polymerase III subunit gamma/tau